MPDLPTDASLRTLAAAIKAQWVCERARQQTKKELGLDDFKGTSWIGLHRRARMTKIAYAFLQSRYLKAAGRKNGAAAETESASNQASHPRPSPASVAQTLSALCEIHRGRLASRTSDYAHLDSLHEGQAPERLASPGVVLFREVAKKAAHEFEHAVTIIGLPAATFPEVPA